MSVNPVYYGPGHAPSLARTPEVVKGFRSVPTPADRADMRCAREDLASLFAHNDVHELMAITPQGHVRDVRTDSLDSALTFIQAQDAAGAIGLYVGCNPLDMSAGGPDGTRPNNGNVVSRTALFLDFDRVGKPEHPATAAELAIIHAARESAQAFLSYAGFPARARRSGLSGNGHYLIYQTDRLPNDNATNTLIKSAVRALREHIATTYPTVHIDTVTDAVRVRRISGTINRKYDEHRMCELTMLDQPPVTRDMLKTLAALSPIAKRTPAPAPTLTLDDHDIMAWLRGEKNGTGIAGPLLDGDNSGYPDYSHARAALAWKACFYSDDAEQVARIIRAAGLYKAGDSDAERDRKAAHDAQQAVSTYSGPRYVPDYRSGDRSVPSPVIPANGDMSEREAHLLVIIAEKDAHIARLQERVQIAEARANQCTTERSRLFGILRNSDLGAARLTGFAIALDFHARIANGEEPTANGLKAPAKRYAEMTGLSENIAAGHMRQLNETGVLRKHVVPEQTEREIEGEIIDSETGEIQTRRETVRGKRDANYIAVPEDGLLSLIDRLATYQRPDDAAKHGGKRAPRPKCEHHPDAGTCTVRHEHIECAQCRAILATSELTETYFPPEPDAESSGTKMMPVTSVVNNVLSDTKMMPEPEPESAPPVTGSIMMPEPVEPSWLFDSLPSHVVVGEADRDQWTW